MKKWVFALLVLSAFASPSFAVDVAVTTVDAPDPVVTNGNVTYTASVTNAGPGDATDVTVFFQFSVGTISTFNGTNGFTCSTAGVPSCYAATMPSGSATLTLVLTAPAAPGTINVTVDLIGSNDTTPGNNANALSTTVVAPNAIPVAHDDAYATPHNTPLVVAAPGVLANDTDAENTPLTVVPGAEPLKGTLVLLSDGSFTYTPNNGATGNDTFTYRASDGGPLSNVATVTINIGAPAGAPAAAADAYQTTQNTGIVEPAPGVLANDAANGPGALSAILDQNTTHGTLILHDDGGFAYTPNAGYAGLDTFTYHARRAGLDSAPVAVTITVLSVPLTAAPDRYATNEDERLVVRDPGILWNDSGGLGGLTAALAGATRYGTVTLLPTGGFTYVPNANANEKNGGGADSFQYDLTDGVTTVRGTVTIDVAAVNDPPIAADDSYVGRAGVPVVLKPWRQYSDPETSNPRALGLTYDDPPHGTITCLAGIDCVYESDANFGGTDSFGYTVTDAEGATASAKIHVRIDCDPVPAIPIRPVANTTHRGGPIRFEWQPAEGAVQYDVVLYTGASTLTLGTVSAPATTYVHDGPLPIETSGWAVVARLPQCQDQVSVMLPLRVAQASCTGTPPLLTAPSATQHTRNIRFAWNPRTSEPAQYRLWIAADGAAPRHQLTTSATSASVTLRAGQQFRWFVEVVRGTCVTRSDQGAFTIDVPQTCGTSAPVIESPAANATVSSGPVSFRVRTPGTATRYELWTSKNGGPENRAGTFTRTGDVSTAAVSLGAGNYSVRAQTLDDFGCASPSSAPLRISVQGYHLFHSVLLSPQEGDTLIAPADIVVRAGSSYRSYPYVRSPDARDWREQHQVLTPGDYVAAVATLFREGEPPHPQHEVHFKVIGAPACGVPPQVTGVAAPRRAASEVAFRISWNALPGVKTYEVEQADFHTQTVRRTTVTQSWATLSVKGRENALSFPQFRVRALDPCTGTPGPFSSWTRIEVGPITLYGSSTVTHLPDGSFSYTLGEIDPYELSLHWEVDHPGFQFTYITLFPPPALKGRRFRFNIPPSENLLVIPAEGEFTNPLVIGLGLRRTQPVTELERVSFEAIFDLTEQIRSNAEASPVRMSIPATIGSVPSVRDAAAGAPPAEARVIPYVVHLEDGDARTVTDLRLTNPSALDLAYDATFSPAGGGLEARQTARLHIAAGDTIVLDDVLGTVFGARGSSTRGQLEIRAVHGEPIAALHETGIVRASSSSGTTLHQIGGVSYEAMLAPGDVAPLVVPWLESSDRFRTVLHIVESSGEAASVRLRFFDDAGNVTREKDVQVSAFDSVAVDLSDVALTRGFVEMTHAGNSGRATAYALVTDRRSGDTMYVGARKTAANAGRQMLVGVARLAGGWRSDVRIVSTSAEPVTAKLVYTAMSRPGERIERTITVPAHGAFTSEDVVASLFESTGGGIVFLDAGEQPLLALGRTYRAAGNGGAVGQLLEALGEDDAASGDRALILARAERSLFTRTNLGLAEVSGQPATVEITAMSRDREAELGPLTIDLAPYELRQLAQVLEHFPVAVDAANVRVRVVGGAGKVVTYGSVIHLSSGDAAYLVGR